MERVILAESVDIPTTIDEYSLHTDIAMMWRVRFIIDASPLIRLYSIPVVISVAETGPETDSSLPSQKLAECCGNATSFKSNLSMRTK